MNTLYTVFFLPSLSLSEICMIHIYMVASENFPVSQEFFPSISENRETALAPARHCQKKGWKVLRVDRIVRQESPDLVFFAPFRRFPEHKSALTWYDQQRYLQSRASNAVSFCHQHFFAQLLFRPSPPTKCPQNSDSGSAQEAGNAFVSNDSWSWQKATVKIAIPGRIISTSFFCSFIDNHREKSQNHGYQTAIH